MFGHWNTTTIIYEVCIIILMQTHCII